MGKDSRKRASRRREGVPTPESEDRAWASYSEQFRTEVMPKLLSSAVFMGLYHGETGDDAEIKFATELGMMLLYDKPIILVTPPGTVVPERLRKVADEVVEFDPDDQATQDGFAAVVRRVLPRE